MNSTPLKSIVIVLNVEPNIHLIGKKNTYIISMTLYIYKLIQQLILLNNANSNN